MKPCIDGFTEGETAWSTSHLNVQNCGYGYRLDRLDRLDRLTVCSGPRAHIKHHSGQGLCCLHRAFMCFHFVSVVPSISLTCMLRVVRFYVNHSSPPCPILSSSPRRTSTAKPGSECCPPDLDRKRLGEIECHNECETIQKEFQKRCQIAWQQELSEVMPDRMPKGMSKDVPECQKICQIERAGPTMSIYARYYM